MFFRLPLKSLALVSFLVMSLSAQGQTVAATSLEKTRQAAMPAKPIAITKGMRAALQQFVNRYAGIAGSQLQHIYIAEVKNENAENTLYACWKEDQSILIMNFFTNAVEEEGLSWLHHKARIDLKTDVVATEAEMSGSNYLVTKVWADNIVNACLQGGQVLSFKSKPGRNKSKSQPE